jgi:hypothetical protein
MHLPAAQFINTNQIILNETEATLSVPDRHTSTYETTNKYLTNYRTHPLPKHNSKKFTFKNDILCSVLVVYR